ncbi:MAG: glycosyltransferase [Azoarcus sp.]|jgi:glycosyltransferase involved in cell wall biosynthesis/predicted HAD superfamily hydrolase|nr:glycosyltransferase [Azoarcus sp.]
MPSSPLISIVIPSYNHAPYVAEAVASALAQDVPLEVVVRDDASSDESWRVLREMRDARLRIVRNDANLGAHATLHAALDEARGDYLAILDSDDRYAPQRLARCLALLRDGPCDLAGTDIRLIDAAGQAVATHWWIDAFARLKAVWRETSDWTAALLEGNVFMTTSNFVFSRRLWEKLAPFSAHRYVHDYDFLLRALIHGARLGWIDEPLLDYRLHEANTIGESPLHANLETAALLREHMPALLAGRGKNSARDATRLRHLGSQWARTERHEQEILLALQHETLTAKDRDWKKLVDDRDQWVAERDQWIEERDHWIEERDHWITERDERIAECDHEIAGLRHEINEFRRRPLISAWRLKTASARARLAGWYACTRQLLAMANVPVLRVGSYAALRRLVEARRTRLDALSFDVFDTLVARVIEPPEHIAKRVAQCLGERIGNADIDGLLAARGEVEAQLRAAAQAAGGDHECHHDDIIAEWIARVTPRRTAEEQAELAGFAAGREYEFERLALTAKPAARLFLQWARAAGLRIVAVSDMYLGERQLRRLLDDLGYGGLIDCIYVSSEHGIGKYSGRLFAEMLAREGLAADRVLHVGDNFHSDALAPVRMGLAGVFFDERHERRRRRRQRSAAMFAERGGVWPGRMLAEVLAERLRYDERAKRDDFFFQYGLEVLGPVFCCFLLGLVERVRRDRPERVFFLARDGELFLRMYEAWGTLAGIELPPAIYAYASRRVVASAALADGLDRERALIGLYNPKQRGLQSILKTYGLAAESFAGIAREHGFATLDERISNWNDPRLAAFLTDERVQEKVRPIGEEARALLHDYFAGLGFFGHARVAMVDIGWNGTIQRFMTSTFGGAESCPHIDGYYFALMDGMHAAALAQGAIEGLMLDRRRGEPQERAACDFEELFEQGARASHATTIGYRRGADGAVEPVLKSDDAPDRQAEIHCNPLIAAMQEGVLLCLEHFHAAQRLTGFGFDALKPYALALIERAVVYPSPREVAELGRLAHTEDFGHDDLLDISARSVRWRDFLHPRTLRAKLALLPWRYAPFARLRTPLAAALARAQHLMLSEGRKP